MTDRSAIRARPHDPAKYQRLLETAAAEFARVGFEQASVDVIAERAGVAKGTVYLYFDSKAGLFRAVLSQLRRMLQETYSVSPEADAEQELRAFIRANLLLAERLPDLYRCYISALFGVNRDFQDAALEIFEWQQGLLLGLLKRLQPRRRQRTVERSGALLAGSILAAALVRGLRWNSDGDTSLEEDALLYGLREPRRPR